MTGDVEFDSLEYTIRTDNEFILTGGQNLPNHSQTIKGLGKFVKVGVPSVVLFRTRQAAYRFAAWLLCMADTLPDEPGEHEFDEILEAVRNA